jgi:hypothetical protein
MNFLERPRHWLLDMGTDLDVCGKIILQYMLGKEGWNVWWTGCSCVRIGTSDGLF